MIDFFTEVTHSLGWNVIDSGMERAPSGQRLSYSNLKFLKQNNVPQKNGNSNTFSFMLFNKL